MTRNKGIARSHNSEAKPDAQMGHTEALNPRYKREIKRSANKKRRRRDKNPD